MKKIYTAIDIGSDTIKFVTAEEHNGNVNVLAAHEEKSKGIRKGLIVDPNLAINAIKDGIKEIRRLLNIDIDKVIVNIPDYNAKFMFVTSEVDINNEDEIVTSEEVNKVIFIVAKKSIEKNILNFKRIFKSFVDIVIVGKCCFK